MVKMTKEERLEQKRIKRAVEVMAATRGPATNLRPGGPMADKRTKRLKTRATKIRKALEEE